MPYTAFLNGILRVTYLVAECENTYIPILFPYLLENPQEQNIGCDMGRSHGIFRLRLLICPEWNPII